MLSSPPEQPETQVSVRSIQMFVLQVFADDWHDCGTVSEHFVLTHWKGDRPEEYRVIRRMVVDFVEQG